MENLTCCCNNAVEGKYKLGYKLEFPEYKEGRFKPKKKNGINGYFPAQHISPALSSVSLQAAAIFPQIFCILN